jgi:pimeloyl-ACP methyl ester carboxylesterase
MQRALVSTDDRTGRTWSHGRPDRSQRRRPLRLLTAMMVAAAILAGCSAGPDPGPDLVIEENNGGAQAPTTTPPPPALDVPKQDLAWRECGADLRQRFPATTLPSGVTFECASFENSVTPGTQSIDTVTVSAVRAKTADTPADAAPLVLTSGTDIASARTLLLLAQGGGRNLLSAHPVVAVDRRGTGTSTPLDCMTNLERNTLLSNGFSDSSTDYPGREERLATAGTSASDGCTEILSPHQVQFTANNAAADLDKLRTLWQVDRIGVAGVGEGADVALAYAGLYTDHVGRLILDTPAPYSTNAQTTGQQLAEGTGAALGLFADQCRAVSCSLGADPGVFIASLLDRARAGDLDGISDTDMLLALTTTIALAPGDRAAIIAAAADMLSAADGGDVGPLRAAIASARALRGTDGQLLSQCNDTAEPVGRNQIDGLITEWSRQYPLTGANAALSLLRCNGFPAGASPPTVGDIPVPVLMFTGSGDTITGPTASDGINGALIGAGATSAILSWEGLGYSVLAHSDCAGEAAIAYARSGEPPAPGACPA